MTTSAAHSMLPPLSADERQHGEQLLALLRAELRAAGGWLSFERFMDLALYAPGLGYYSAGSVKLGAGGDFVTAPEMSDLFGRCLARQCADVLRVTGGDIVEFGAGSGRLAGVLLQGLAACNQLPERYAILEVSADLAARQRATLGQLPPRLRERIVWLQRLPEQPVRGVLLANEVADALPVRRFARRGAALLELGVAAGADSQRPLTEQAVTAPEELREACVEIEAAVGAPFADGYASEVCLRLSPWLASLSDCLECGLVLLSDYGLPRRHYYHPQRMAGTLRCHFRHRAHDDPYINLGVQDITAWVDFTRVAEAALDAGLTVSGFATQAAFLVSLGLEALVAEAASPVERARLAGEARRLVMPEEMGEAFKMMALTRALEVPLAGFALQDLRHQL
jgi:SAM-dependent MidA family methyltransferase